MITPDKRVSLKLIQLKKVLFFAGLAFFTPFILFCVFYLVLGHGLLTRWYLSLNDCFYKRDSWSALFFTPQTKSTGNILALIGIAISVYFSLLIIIKKRKEEDLPITLSISYRSLSWYGGVTVIALLLGTWSWSLASPAYDEVFSAVNCAELHPFQTLSYYMLPNNHIYFNFLNNVLFSRLHNTIATGRLLSLLAYACVLIGAYHWLHVKIGKRLYALLGLLPIALQFMTWGLAAQARGYELQLLCAWVSFITLFRYLQTGSTRLLKVNTLFCIVGFAMVSTYLHYFIAQLLFMLAVAVIDKKMHWQFFKYQAYVVAVVFLLYLPALCFSGIPAFTANRYVIPAYANWHTFLPDFIDLLRYFINCCFSMLFGEDRVPNFVLFFLPLSLFFFPKKEQRLIALFYVLLWAVFIVITLNMRRIPFTRNMILHFSLTMGIVVYTFYSLIQKAAALLSVEKMKTILVSTVFAIPVLCYCIYLAKTDRRDISHYIYCNDVNEIYTGHTKELAWIPPTASIAFSDECFFLYYMFRKDHPNAHRCPTGQEDYYIKRKDDPMPSERKDAYIKWRDGSEDYEYYVRR